MGILKTLGGRLQIAVLLPMALSMLTIVGCGDTPQAPYGAVMTVDLYNTYNGSLAAGDVNTKVYRVTMKDAAGVPMNGLKVNLYGTFSAGSNINMAGSIGSAPLGGSININSSIELNGSGVQDIIVTAPTITATAIPIPFITGIIDLPGSGSLIGGRFYGYAVTALDAASPVGQTFRSTFSYIQSGGSATNNAVQVTWTPVNGAAAYNVYGCSAVATGCNPATLLATVPPSTTVYIDRTGTGSGVGAGAFGSAQNIAVNTVIGTIDVQSGSVYQLLNVSLP